MWRLVIRCRRLSTPLRQDKPMLIDTVAVIGYIGTEIADLLNRLLSKKSAWSNGEELWSLRKEKESSFSGRMRA